MFVVNMCNNNSDIVTSFRLKNVIFRFKNFRLNIQWDGFNPWEEEKSKRKSRTAAATGLVKEAGGYSNAYRCDLLFWQAKNSLQFTLFMYNIHAESPPPKTLISHGARDWVQTSTSPDEISF